MKERRWMPFALIYVLIYALCGIIVIAQIVITDHYGHPARVALAAILVSIVLIAVIATHYRLRR